MAWLAAIAQVLQIFGLLLNWWKESDDKKSQEKLDALKKVLQAAQDDNQEEMRNAINAFNSL